VIINTNASVDHECVLENFVHISPGAILTGNVHVGEGTHIGAGATVIPGVRIGKWCTIGAGSVIIRDGVLVVPKNVHLPAGTVV
jgi:acetyltransferase EpsM